MKTQRGLPYGLLFFLTAFASLSYGQFNASIQGVIQDPSGGVVPKATVTLVNVATQVSCQDDNRQRRQLPF